MTVPTAVPSAEKTVRDSWMATVSVVSEPEAVNEKCSTEPPVTYRPSAKVTD